MKHWPHVLPLLVPVLAVAGVFLPDLVRAQLRRSRWLLAAAVASVAAAAVHVVVTPEHFEESALYGVFFVALSAGQLGYAVALLVRPTRRLLAAGVVASTAAVLLWAVTRTVGLPAGPFAWQREEVGVLDLLAVTAEMVVVVALVRALRNATAQVAAAPPRQLVSEGA